MSVSWAPMPDSFEGWLTVADAAAKYGLNRSRLQKAASTGRLPARKVGSGATTPWLVREDDVLAFAASSRRGMRSDLRRKAAGATETEGHAGG